MNLEEGAMLMAQVKDASRLFIGVLISLFIITGGIGTIAFAAEQDTILSSTNSTRSAQGLGPLNSNAGLNAVALEWSKQMAASNELYHNPNVGSQIPAGWEMWGENVAYVQGYPDPGKQIFQNWMNSPPHKTNILKPEFTDIGIGVYTDPQGRTWATQVFARYPSNPSTPSAPESVPAPEPSTQEAPPKINPNERKVSADTTVKQVQQTLAELGYSEVGKADNIAGSNTSHAIRLFQQDASFPVTGLADASTLEQLSIKKAAGWTRPLLSQAPEVTEVDGSEKIPEPAPGPTPEPLASDEGATSDRSNPPEPTMKSTPKSPQPEGDKEVPPSKNKPGVIPVIGAMSFFLIGVVVGVCYLVYRRFLA